ncbi:Hypothetical protein NTJ_13954 [Nesidiocoris tenuis]|uniref:PHD-type domain-containing protein n=1 Tax=Nesidiocoris tenuis TaxID=355587 RepID=A0ABN7B9U0_9HEMI|nr:Hypothetical protein NTJ_13954 [Nesidiocoris tenuis]
MRTFRQKKGNPPAGNGTPPTKRLNFVKKKEQCPVCGEIVTENSRGIQCDGECSNWFHCKCAGVTQSFYDSLTEDDVWLCSSCTQDDDGQDNSPNAKQTMDALTHVLKSSKINIARKDVSNKDLATSINGILSALVEICHSLAFQSDTHDELIKTNKNLTDQLSKISECNERLKNENQSLSWRVNKLEQMQLDAECEIHGFPAAENENLTEIARRICETVKCDHQTNEIVNIYRAKSNPTRKDRSPPIVIKFKSAEAREKLIQAKKNHGSLQFAALGLEGQGAVYINERLTLYNRNLLWLAKNTRSIGYKFAWTKNGNIYLRKDENSAARLIRTPDDLPKQ